MQRAYELASPKDHVCVVAVLQKNMPRDKHVRLGNFTSLHIKRDERSVAAYEDERKTLEQMLAFCTSGMPNAQAFKGRISSRLEEGDAREMILFAGIAVSADYIVLGGRGDGSIKNPRHVGSVTEYVIRNSPCSVIVVKSPREE